MRSLIWQLKKNNVYLDLIHLKGNRNVPFFINSKYINMLIDKIKTMFYEDIVKLVNRTPNDRVLGRKVRAFIQDREKSGRRKLTVNFYVKRRNRNY